MNSSPDLHIRAHGSTCQKEKARLSVQNDASHSLRDETQGNQSRSCLSPYLWMQYPSSLLLYVAQHCHSPVRFSARRSLAPPPSIRGCKELRSRWCPLLTGQVRNVVERSSHNHSSCLQALPFPMWVYFGCQACKENPSHSWNGEAGLCVSTGVCFVDEWSSAFPGGNGLNPWFLKHNRRWWCHILLR